MSKEKTVVKRKKIVLDTRQELDMIIPAKVALHPHTFLNTNILLFVEDGVISVNILSNSFISVYSMKK